MADPRFTNGIQGRGAEVERRRCEDRGATGTEGLGCGLGGVPSPEIFLDFGSQKSKWQL